MHPCRTLSFDRIELVFSPWVPYLIATVVLDYNLRRSEISASSTPMLLIKAHNLSRLTMSKALVWSMKARWIEPFLAFMYLLIIRDKLRHCSVVPNPPLKPYCV